MDLLRPGSASPRPGSTPRSPWRASIEKIGKLIPTRQFPGPGLSGGKGLVWSSLPPAGGRVAEPPPRYSFFARALSADCPAMKRRSGRTPFRNGNAGMRIREGTGSGKPIYMVGSVPISPRRPGTFSTPFFTPGGGGAPAVLCKVPDSEETGPPQAWRVRNVRPEGSDAGNRLSAWGYACLQPSKLHFSIVQPHFFLTPFPKSGHTATA
ncbi:MAG: hypothetical protein JWP91_708 [Fibrobacteres bacterium]|nr:hypothetical protein [Fibrobacterota bacterium]